jgi:hypothetical protein
MTLTHDDGPIFRYYLNSPYYTFHAYYFLLAAHVSHETKLSLFGHCTSPALLHSGRCIYWAILIPFLFGFCILFSSKAVGYNVIKTMAGRVLGLLHHYLSFYFHDSCFCSFLLARVGCGLSVEKHFLRCRRRLPHTFGFRSRHKTLGLVVLMPL